MVIEALIQRRESMAAEMRQLRDNIHHLDVVIKMFEGASTKPRKQRGEVTRAMLNILREATAPMTAREIAEKMGTEVNRVGVALSLQRRRGTVKASGEAGSAYAWEIVAGAKM